MNGLFRAQSNRRGKKGFSHKVIRTVRPTLLATPRLSKLKGSGSRISLGRTRDHTRQELISSSACLASASHTSFWIR